MPAQPVVPRSYSSAYLRPLLSQLSADELLEVIAEILKRLVTRPRPTFKEN